MVSEVLLSNKKKSMMEGGPFVLSSKVSSEKYFSSSEKKGQAHESSRKTFKEVLKADLILRDDLRKMESQTGAETPGEQVEKSSFRGKDPTDQDTKEEYGISLFPSVQLFEEGGISSLHGEEKEETALSANQGDIQADSLLSSTAQEGEAPPLETHVKEVKKDVLDKISTFSQDFSPEENQKTLEMVEAFLPQNPEREKWAQQLAFTEKPGSFEPIQVSEKKASPSLEQKEGSFEQQEAPSSPSKISHESIVPEEKSRAEEPYTRPDLLTSKKEGPEQFFAPHSETSFGEIRAIPVPSASFSLHGVTGESLSPQTYTSHATAVVSQVSQGFYAARQESLQKFHIQLNPPSLGLVDVNVDLKEGRMKAIFSAKEDTLNLLKDHAHELKISLQTMGLDVENGAFEFMLNTGGDASPRQESFHPFDTPEYAGQEGPPQERPQNIPSAYRLNPLRALDEVA